MSQYRSVGWFNDSEWEAVYYNLFYGDKTQIRAALDRIAVWRARFAGRIPVAVEATSLLFECVIKEENDEIKRMGMATALSQFVGLLTERSLKGQTYHKPLHIRAEELGIPEWVINVRHETAHCLLPSYFMIDKAMNFALSWLRTNHWDVQLKKQKISTEPPIVVMDDAVEVLRDILLSTLERCAVQSSTMEKLTRTFGSKSHAPILAQILLDYNFIPLDRGKENCLVYSKAIGNFQYRINPSLETFFKRILQILAENHTLGNFFAQLIATSNLKSTNRKLWNIWVEFILDFISCNLDFVQDNEWKLIIAELLKTKSSTSLVERVLSLSGIHDYTSVIELTKLITGEGQMGYISCVDRVTHMILETEDPKVTGNTTKTSGRDPLHESSGNPPKTWTLYHTENLSECPLGVMPGQNLENLWGELSKSKLKPIQDTSFVEDDMDYATEPDVDFTDSSGVDLQYILSGIDIL